MSSISIFSCIKCRRTYNISEIKYRCDCGDLLEVIHDFNESIPNAEKWKKSLDNKLNVPSFQRYHEILFPSLPIEKIVTLHEGDTPLYDVSHFFPNFGSLIIDKFFGISYSSSKLLFSLSSWVIIRCSSKLNCFANPIAK